PRRRREGARAGLLRHEGREGLPQRALGEGGTLIAALVLLLSTGPVPAEIEKIVREFPGTIGVAATNLATGETIAVNADLRFPTASLIKVAVMVEVYHQIAEGRIRRDTAVTLHDSDKAGDETVPLTPRASRATFAPTPPTSRPPRRAT
ncbi:MAG TPA: serine hydrolase, partial [Thermoanaerobaculia bacterium]|nr:serine hydrolase [Thermoanaerobaculia bacterium]